MLFWPLNAPSDSILPGGGGGGQISSIDFVSSTEVNKRAMALYTSVDKGYEK